MLPLLTGYRSDCVPNSRSCALAGLDSVNQIKLDRLKGRSGKEFSSNFASQPVGVFARASAGTLPGISH